MRHWLLAAAVLLLGSAAWGAQNSGETSTLTHGDFSAVVSRQSGRVVSITRAIETEHFTRPVAISLRDEITGESSDVNSPLEEARLTDTSYSFRQRAGDVVVETRISIGDDLSWEVHLKNAAEERRDLSVWFDLGGLPTDYHAFFPSMSSPNPSHPIGHDLLYGYRTDGVELTIPSVTFYAPSERLGLTVISPLEIPIQPFQVKVKPSGEVGVGRIDLKLNPRGEVATRIFLSLHEADWRPGLKYVRDKYPTYFMAGDTRAVDINGSFMGYAPVATEELVKQWQEHGVRWVEVHFTYPFLGKYFPDQPSWTPATDDEWAYLKELPGQGVPKLDAPYELIRAYVEKRLGAWETPDRVRSFIRLLHRYNIKALMYYQPTECWIAYAAAYFMPDLIRGPDGETEPTWYEDIVLDPRPGSAWANYLEAQFKGLLDLYPEADGIFMDQATDDGIDYNHDDGFTIRKGRPGYRMGYAICALTSKLVEYAHARGKVVWWNGPYQIEIASVGDGYLAEDTGEAFEWLGIGDKPITSTGGGNDYYDRMLLIGSQVVAPSVEMVEYYCYMPEVRPGGGPSAEQVADFQRYQPLFEQIRKRQWVLTANAVETPRNFEANIFRQPNGNYAVPVITPWVDDTTGTAVDVPVTVRVPDAESIRGVYLLSADLSGWFRVPWKQSGDSVEARIPRHRRASLLLFAKSGFFAAIEENALAIEGQRRGAKLVLDNFLSQPAAGEVRIGSDALAFKLVPQASIALAIPASALSAGQESKISLPVEVRFSSGGVGEALKFKQQILRVPVLECGWTGTLWGYLNERSAVTFCLINHGAKPQAVHLTAEGVGLKIADLPHETVLRPSEQKSLQVEVEPERPGITEIRLHVIAGTEQAFTVKFPVWKTRFSQGAKAVDGRVEYGEFVPSGMEDPLRVGHGTARPIKVDGRLAGSIESRNQSRWLDGWSVPLSRDLLLEMGLTIEVSFYPANANDEFRLRNFRLVLRRADRSELASPLDAQELSTKPADGGPARPITVKLTLPRE